MFGFEKLDVWQKAIEFADHMYRKTAGFPAEERFGLTSQLRRASVSISSNIAEGSGRGSQAEFGRFVSIGYGSLLESVAQLHIALHQQFMGNNDFDQLVVRAEELARMLSGLKSSLTSNA